MKNYLKISLVITILVVKISYLYANDKLNYYANVLKGWGVTTTTESTSSSNNYYGYITLSSELTTTDSTFSSIPYRNVFIVCDNNITLTNIFCSYDNVISKNPKEMVTIRNTTLVHTTTNSNKSIYFIPEIYFISPNSAVNIGSYFYNLPKQQSSDFQKTTTDIISGGHLYKDITYMIALCFCLVILLIIVVNLYSIIKNHKLIIVVRNYYNIIETNSDLYKQGFLLLIILGIFSSLAFIAYVTLKAVSVSTLSNSLHLKPAFLIYLCILGLFWSFGHITYIRNKVTRNILLIKNKKLNYLTIRNISGIILLLLVIVLPFSKLNTKPIISLISCLILCLSLLALKLKNCNFSTILSLKGGILFFCFLVLIFYLASVINSRLAKDNAITTISLVNQDKLIVLPSTINNSDHIRFNSYTKDFSFKVFANDFLLYDPQHSHINNNPYSEITKIKGTYLVMLPENTIEYAHYLLNNPSSRLVFQTTAPSNIFRFETNHEPVINENIYIDFDCDSLVPGQVIIFNKINNEKEEEVKVLNFPGCSIPSSTVQYHVPFDMDASAIYLVDEGNSFKINNISIKGSNGKIYNTIFYKVRTENIPYILNPDTDTSDTLNVYSLTATKRIDFNRTSNEFDLGNAINQLKDDNYLKNTFVIWSDSANALLNNSL